MDNLKNALIISVKTKTFKIFVFILLLRALVFLVLGYKYGYIDKFVFNILTIPYAVSRIRLMYIWGESRSDISVGKKVLDFIAMLIFLIITMPLLLNIRAFFIRGLFFYHYITIFSLIIGYLQNDKYSEKKWVAGFVAVFIFTVLIIVTLVSALAFAHSGYSQETT